MYIGLRKGIITHFPFIWWQMEEKGNVSFILPTVIRELYMIKKEL